MAEIKIKGAIFDFDGTLYDSMYVWRTFGDKFLGRRQLKIKPDLKKRMRAMTLRQVACLMREEYALPDSVRSIMDEINEMVENSYKYDVIPKDGVPEMLEKFKENGVKMCIATATDRYQIVAALERCGLEGYFDEIFTCTETGSGKDSTPIFENALKLLGTEKENTAVFEDAAYSMKTAKGMGLRIVGVYDPYAAEELETIKKLTDVYINSYDELWQHIFF